MNIERRTLTRAAQGRIRPGRGSLPPRQLERLRESADQLLFRPAAGWRRSTGQGLLGIRGDVTSGAARGAARTLLWATAKGPRLGALPGRADEEARKTG